MDSNFRVNITTDISELQAGLKRVQAELDKFKKSANGASTATRNMEQNANRGRMVAFAFGQVIRDAGFFANSFSLGILAISNNVPILIDQLTLSVKALQPFAGYITIASSLLTAALTIWAYSAQAVEKKTNSLEEYTKTLDATNKAQLKGVENSSSELTTLRLLYEQTQNTTLSLKSRKKAVDELQELYPKYFANLSDEAILAGKGAKNYTELTNSIIASAKVRGGADIIAENTKEEYLLQKRITDAKAAQAELDAQKALEQQIYNAGSIKQSKEFAKELQLRKLNNILNAAAISDIDKIGAMQLRLNQLKGDDLKIQNLINSEIEKGGSLTEDFSGKAEDIQSYTSIMQSLNDEFQRLDFLFTGTFGEKQEGRIKAIQSAIESLRKIGFEKTSKEVSTLAQEILFLEQALKIPTAKEPVKITQTVSAQPVSGIGAKITNEDLAKENQRIENIRELSRAYDRWSLSVQNADEWVQYLAQTVGGELVNSFNSMLTTGTFSFEGIGKAILGMIKKLAAAAMAAAILSSILSSLFPGAGNSGFKDIFGAITGIRLSAGTTAVAPVAGAMTTTGINTSMTNSAAMATTSQPVLETRVSGNDLVILLDRATNNRNKYF